jgi:hypothetical protein
VQLVEGRRRGAQKGVQFLVVEHDDRLRRVLDPQRLQQ